MAQQLSHSWRKRARRAAAGTGLVAGGALMSTLGVAYYVVRNLTGPNKPGPMDAYVMTPFETGVDYEEVMFTPEGSEQRLTGWWLSRPESSRVIIGCGGYRGSKSDLIGISTALWRAGFNVLLFDYRGYGADRGTPITLAYRELADFLGALTYVKQRVADARIGVIGYSMGASVAIMGAARRTDVRAVIADSPFATHADIVSYRISQVIRLPGQPIAAVADYLLPHVAGYRGRDVSPLREVTAIAPRPILLIHGTSDTAIPAKHTRQIYAAASEPKELWLAEGAEHCGAYFLDRPAYCARAIGFFTRHLDETHGEHVDVGIPAAVSAQRSGEKSA